MILKQKSIRNKKIDDDLGGTTPLNVILKFPKTKASNIDDDTDEIDNWMKKTIGLQRQMDKLQIFIIT